MRALDGGRVNIAACSLGAARACLERATAHLRERQQFGRKLAEFQALQFRLADMATELEAARTFVWRAAAALDRRDADATMLCAMAKRFGTDVGFEVANQALQLHGGYGYLSEYGIEKIVRDLRVHHYEQQKVAQFLAKMRFVLSPRGLGRFVGLLNERWQ